MFGAFRGPILRTPTLLYSAGVPGEGNPGSRSNFVAAVADAGHATAAAATARRAASCPTAAPGYQCPPVWVRQRRTRTRRYAMAQTKAGRSAAAKEGAAMRKRNGQRA